MAAHRGTDGRMPENGLESIRQVTATTNGLVELDVATSSDGVLFLHHDDTLDRTTTGTGPADIPWSELRELSLRDAAGRVTAQRIARLDEVLDWAEGRAILELDIKQGTRYDDVAAILAEKSAGGRVVVIAYTLAQARLMASKFPDSMISATIRSTDDLEALVAAGVPKSRLLAWTGNDAPDPDLYRALDEAGVEVIFGTLGGRDSFDERIARSGEDETYAALGRDGVDILATDRPVEASEALRAGGRSGDGACPLP